MRALKTFLATVAATGLVAGPTIAQANPAASLSLSNAAPARAATSTEGNELTSAGIVPLILVAVVIGVGIYLVVDDDDSDSN